MKKLFIILFTLISICSIAQKNIYKIGIITPLPVDIYGGFKLSIASSFFGYEKVLSKKFNFTANSGYLRFTDCDEKFGQIPILIGTKYNINEQFYLGAGTGVVLFDEKKYGTYLFTYSPYIGINFKKLSVETRYFNSINSEVPPKYLSLVFNYQL